MQRVCDCFSPDVCHWLVRLRLRRALPFCVGGCPRDHAAKVILNLLTPAETGSNTTGVNDYVDGVMDGNGNAIFQVR